MQESNSFFNVLQQYFADSTLLPLFVIALIWIIKKWKPEYKRNIIAMLLAGIFVFNELVYRIFVRVGEDITYYRLLWTIPIVFIIAVFVVECAARLNKYIQVGLVGISLLAVFLFSEQITMEKLALPENIYQVDGDVIQVADKVMELTGGESVYFLDNGGLYMSIRQYEPRIVYTHMEEYGLSAIIEGKIANALGSNIIEATYDDRSKYLGLRKDKPLALRMVESAGHTLITSTDNYQIYGVDYYTVHWDWIKRTELSAGLIDQVTIEYIPVSNVEERYSYIYISDFGSTENKAVYEELFEKIKNFQPQGIIINDQLAANSDWYKEYKEQLDELNIPYYCNNKEYQIIEEKEFIVCMIDNTDGISEETEKAFLTLEQRNKPVILVLSAKVENTKDKLYAALTEKEFVVQVLSAKKGGYTKDLVGETLLQYAVPVDENQLFSIIYLKDLGVQGRY